MTTMKEKIEAARFKLTQPEFAPYLSRVAFALRFVPAPGLGTLGVDSKLRLFYDPDIEGKWTIDELVGVMAHECHHVLRDHAHRMPPEGKSNRGLAHTWNLAGDAEINDDLVDSGIPMPKRTTNPETKKEEGFVLPKDIPADNGLTAEEYYLLLKQKQEEEGNGNGNPEGEGNPAAGNCGGIADGDDDGTPGDASGVEGVESAEGEIIRRQTAKDIQDYAKSRGSVPAGLKRWADETLDSKVPWQQELAAIVRNAYAQAKGKVDYTYRKPNNRRMSGQGGFVMPSLYQPQPAIAFVVDTSGSMGQRELASGLAEINGVLKAQGASQNLTVLSVDAEVHKVKKVFSARQIESLPGGGGTDMRVGIAEALRRKAEVIIVFTDGYTPWPADAPRVPVIVCLTHSGERSSIPVWARVVTVND